MLQLTTVFFLLASSVLAVLHSISLKLFLYWRYEWLDIPMHFLGGVVVALGFFTAYDFRVFRNKKWLKPVYVLTFVMLIAVTWECYELFIGVPMEDNYTLDTATDLLMGLLGGYIGTLVAGQIRKL